MFRTHVVFVALCLGIGTFALPRRPHYHHAQPNEICEDAKTCVTEPIDLGCFYINSSNPFCKDLFPPQQPDQLGLRFELYTPTRRDQSSLQLIPYDDNLDTTITNLDMNAQYPLSLVIHGFDTNYNSSWMISAKDSMINNFSPVNVLLCYWAAGSSPGLLGLDYYQASSNTRVVGAIIAEIVARFKTLKGVDMSTTTMAGHSLGAHVSGFTGERLRSLKGLSLDRIIALDPAGPLFDSDDGTPTPTETRIDPSDANFVHCIHTNGVDLFHVPPGCGTLSAWGHVDFYPNGGQYQPGCLDINPDCNHGRSHDYFVDFMNAKGDTNCPVVYPSWQCSDYDNFKSAGCMTTGARKCNNIGYNLHASNGCSGKYYFDTSEPQDNIWNVKYTGCQYNAAFVIDGDDYGGGTLTMEIAYVDGTVTTFDNSPLFTSDTSFHVSMQQVTTTPCTQSLVKGVVLNYDHNFILHPQSDDTLPVKSFVLTDALGNSYSSSGPFQLPDDQNVQVLLSPTRLAAQQ